MFTFVVHKFSTRPKLAH